MRGVTRWNRATIFTFIGPESVELMPLNRILWSSRAMRFAHYNISRKWKKIRRVYTHVAVEARSAGGIGVIAAVIRDGAGAEQGGAGANFGGAFFDGDFEVVAHAHGQNRQRFSDAPRYLIAQFGEFAEKRADCFGLVEERRNGHQPTQLQIREGADAFGQRGQVCFRNSAFRRLVAEVNFDQDAEFFIFGGRRSVEPLREREAIDRIDAIEQPCGSRGFVALQVADQVPGGSEIGKRRSFAFEFLNAIFAEVAQASLVGREDRFGWMGFGDGDDGDFLGAPAGMLRGASDALADVREVGGDGRGGISHWRDSSMSRRNTLAAQSSIKISPCEI